MVSLGSVVVSANVIHPNEHATWYAFHREVDREVALSSLTLLLSGCSVRMRQVWDHVRLGPTEINILT